MTERFELMKKTLSQMLEERKYTALRDVLETMYPAVMASPFITTVVDALSLLVYFFFAKLLLHI